MAQILAQTGNAVHCRYAMQQSRRPFGDALSARNINRTVVCALRSDSEMALPRRQLLATGKILQIPSAFAQPRCSRTVSALYLHLIPLESISHGKSVIRTGPAFVSALTLPDIAGHAFARVVSTSVVMPRRRRAAGSSAAVGQPSGCRG